MPQRVLHFFAIARDVLKICSKMGGLQPMINAAMNVFAHLGIDVHAVCGAVLGHCCTGVLSTSRRLVTIALLREYGCRHRFCYLTTRLKVTEDGWIAWQGRNIRKFSNCFRMNKLTYRERNKGLLRIGSQVEAFDDAANGIDSAQCLWGRFYGPLSTTFGLDGAAVAVTRMAIRHCNSIIWSHWRGFLYCWLKLDWSTTLFVQLFLKINGKKASWKIENEVFGSQKFRRQFGTICLKKSSSTAKEARS